MESFSIKDGSFCIAEFLIVLPLFQVFLDKPSISIMVAGLQRGKAVGGSMCLSSEEGQGGVHSMSLGWKGALLVCLT